MSFFLGGGGLAAFVWVVIVWWSLPLVYWRLIGPRERTHAGESFLGCLFFFSACLFGVAGCEALIVLIFRSTTCMVLGRHTPDISRILRCKPPLLVRYPRQALLLMEAGISKKWLTKWWNRGWASPAVAMRVVTVQVGGRRYAVWSIYICVCVQRIHDMVI